VIALPPPPFLFGATPYCQGQPFVPFTVTGTGVLWYTTPTGGVGNSVAPSVPTSVPGTYTYYASQTVNGCEGPRASVTTEVLNFINPAYNYTVRPGCHGDTVYFSNFSTGALQYLWTFGDGTDDTATSPMHVYRSQGTFYARLTAYNGHCMDSLVDTITLSHPIKASFTVSPDTVCQHNPVTFTNTSTGAGLTYMWYMGNGAIANTSNTTYTYNRSGVYDVMLIASNAIPCNDTAVQTVYVDSQSSINIGVTDSVLCRSTSVTFTGNYSSIGNTGVTWYFGDGDSLQNSNPVVHSYDVFGTYTVYIKAHYRACLDTSTTRIVSIFQSPNINLGSDTSICKGSQPLTITDRINEKTVGARWKWNTGQTTPSITVTEPGYYSAVVNVNGCTGVDTVWVQNDCYLNISNVFSPNADGINDYFFPRQYLTRGLTTFSMQIYNRWGQLIFETNTLDGSGWDGKLNNVDQPQGVYVYVIDATFKDGQKEHHQGNVTLIR
jgi:gliding motility-associated-like protein